MLTLMDEYSRECLAIEVERKLNSSSILEKLGELFVERGTPQYLRSDNGSEFTAKVVREWLAWVGVGTVGFAQSGSFVQPTSATPLPNVGRPSSFYSSFSSAGTISSTSSPLRRCQSLVETKGVSTTFGYSSPVIVLICLTNGDTCRVPSIAQ